jgi:hypothetical protein
MPRAFAATSALVLLAASCLAACNRGGSSESGDAATTDDGGDDASTGGDVTETAISIESPSDAAPGDAAPLPAACAGYDAGAPPYASLAGGTVVGSGVSATVCAATDVYISSFLSPANLLLLQITGTLSTDLLSPAGATEGTLALMISVGTDTPAVYTSSQSQSCGFMAFTYALPPAPDEVFTYQAAATSDCSDPTTVSGSWAVTLTQVTPYQGNPEATGAHYVAHGSLTAMLPAANGGTGAVTVSLSF